MAIWIGIRESMFSRHIQLVDGGVDSVLDHPHNGKVAMARVSNDMLREWLAVLDHVVTRIDAGQTVPSRLAEEVHRVSDQAAAILTKAEETQVSGRKKGLGRGLDALIPAHATEEIDVENLRNRLRQIAEDAGTTDQP